MIKIDAEGFELKIIMGAKELLNQHKPYLIFEYWPHKDNSLQALQSLAYKVYQLVWVSDPINPKEGFLELRELLCGAAQPMHSKKINVFACHKDKLIFIDNYVRSSNNQTL